MTLSKLSEKCKACPKVDSCDHKKMELCALAELQTNMCVDAEQTASASLSAPILRERIDSPLSSFAYKDELEKALNDAYFGNRFMTFGV
nr:MAG TPA: hypothetical protein [Caudoviricetes sp.]